MKTLEFHHSVNFIATWSNAHISKLLEHGAFVKEQSLIIHNTK